MVTARINQSFLEKQDPLILIKIKVAQESVGSSQGHALAAAAEEPGDLDPKQKERERLEEALRLNQPRGPRSTT
jgi:hypothetical protein